MQSRSQFDNKSQFSGYDLFNSDFLFIFAPLKLAIMTEVKRIQKRLARNGRVAYKAAKSSDSAFIVMGNSIYRMSADGSKDKVEVLASTRVKTKQKKFVIK